MARSVLSANHSREMYSKVTSWW